MKPLALLFAAASLALVAAPDMAAAKGPKGCPPGLAKKSPACVPPGLAAKGVERHDRDEYRDRDGWDRYHEDDYRVLRRGDVIVLDGREYVVVDTDDGTLIRRNDSYYRLPRIGDGSEYVRVGDAIVRVDRKTRAVIQMIELADLILN